MSASPPSSNKQDDPSPLDNRMIHSDPLPKRLKIKDPREIHSEPAPKRQKRSVPFSPSKPDLPEVEHVEDVRGYEGMQKRPDQTGTKFNPQLTLNNARFKLQHRAMNYPPTPPSSGSHPESKASHVDEIFSPQLRARDPNSEEGSICEIHFGKDSLYPRWTIQPTTYYDNTSDVSSPISDYSTGSRLEWRLETGPHESTGLSEELSYEYAYRQLEMALDKPEFKHLLEECIVKAKPDVEDLDNPVPALPPAPKTKVYPKWVDGPMSSYTRPRVAEPPVTAATVRAGPFIDASSNHSQSPKLNSPRPASGQRRSRFVSDGGPVFLQESAEDLGPVESPEADFDDSSFADRFGARESQEPVTPNPPDNSVQFLHEAPRFSQPPQEREPTRDRQLGPLENQDPVINRDRTEFRPPGDVVDPRNSKPLYVPKINRRIRPWAGGDSNDVGIREKEVSEELEPDRSRFEQKVDKAVKVVKKVVKKGRKATKKYRTRPLSDEDSE